ncbi:type II secretion system minor pseudopilin GspK [Marinicella gelatinilytica]|uniref:type II secretion system minor pseudopilin GspK n=1 Tax=Marinicella gelatinilytica TaxID=2996017 RepID=UPI002260FF20|nr:type II secretion system minor pseudopilin GspK [Marinicella gelatinilytica]MCX7544269.1 type II secretion system minor pseudopilin GspK [Marinicella gelatinilytica]
MVKQRQQGMALLMALVMMAIAVTLVAGIWYSSRLTLFRTHHLQQKLQAKHLSQGLLLWASDLLEKDYTESDQFYDNSADPWHQGIQGIIVEQAVLSGELNGMNHLFNVNNLVINDVISVEHEAYFRRLLTALNLDVNITDKIMDWIDQDQEPRQGGAEDFAYAAEIPPYKTAGGPFSHVNELRLIAGMDDSQFNQLLPYVTALPVTNGATLMNINTLPPVMIKALDNSISEELAIRIYQQCQASFTTMEDFYKFDTIQYLDNIKQIKPILNQLIGVQTRYMQARTEVAFKDNRQHGYVLLWRRNNGASQVVMRSPVPFLPSNLVN